MSHCTEDVLCRIWQPLDTAVSQLKSRRKSLKYATSYTPYFQYVHPVFFFSLEESGVLTDCSIQTQDADEILDFDFCSANVVNKVIMNAECLREVFAELDMSSEALEVLLSPSPPYCRLSTSGYAGTTQVRNV